MGKEWLYYWSGSGGGGSRRHSSRRSKKNGITYSSSKREAEKENGGTTTTSSGCMNAVLHLFDFHPFHHIPNLHHSHLDSNFLPDVPVLPLNKGVEAPRNCLEVIEDTKYKGPPATLSSSNMKKLEQTYNIPMGMQVKTTSVHTRSSAEQDISFCDQFRSSSPAGTKTPTLVARLMGLDLIPETSSPRASSSSSNHPKSHVNLHHQQAPNHPKNIEKPPSSSAIMDDIMVGTPRLSSSARKSDVDRRLSLQINKENSYNEMGTCQEFEFSKFLTRKITSAAARRNEDENMTPGNYAKEIVKQFKEGVSKRVGRDITNTVKSSTDYQRRDQNVVLVKSKKPSNLRDCHESTTPNSCSPRLRFLEKKNKPIPKNNQTCHSPKILSDNDQLSTPKARDAPQKELEQKQLISSAEKCKKLKKPPQTSDLIRNKQEEPFVRSTSTTRASQFSNKKCKNTPLSNLPTLVSVRRDHPSPSGTRLLQNQEMQKQSQEGSVSVSSKKNTQLSSKLSHRSYKQERIKDNDNPNGTDTVAAAVRSTVVSGEEEQVIINEYVSAILNCTGIHEFTPISSFSTKWYTLSHPIGPSIYYKLPKLNHGYGGRLIFELVDELLAEMLKPHFNSMQWGCRISDGNEFSGGRRLYGWKLLKMLCRKIGSFPAKDCRVMEDIDEVINEDMGGRRRRLSEYEEDEEKEGIVMEIEGEIMEKMVHETVVAMAVVGVHTEGETNRI